MPERNAPWSVCTNILDCHSLYHNLREHYGQFGFFDSATEESFLQLVRAHVKVQRTTTMPVHRQMAAHAGRSHAPRLSKSTGPPSMTHLNASSHKTYGITCPSDAPKDRVNIGAPESYDLDIVDADIDAVDAVDALDALDAIDEIEEIDALEEVEEIDALGTVDALGALGALGAPDAPDAPGAEQTHS